jgi:hypothetical protein
MRKKKFDRVRFLIALGVSGIAWIVGLLSMDTRSFFVDSSGYAIPMYPHPLFVALITTAVLGITAYMWRWYRMDRVQRALSSLNETERGELIQRLAQSMKPELMNLATSDRLTLNDDGELEESVVSHKRKNDQAVRGAGR